jgi:hypothetical protein
MKLDFDVGSSGASTDHQSVPQWAEAPRPLLSTQFSEAAQKARSLSRQLPAAQKEPKEADNWNLSTDHIPHK